MNTNALFAGSRPEYGLASLCQSASPRGNGACLSVLRSVNIASVHHARKCHSHRMRRAIAAAAPIHRAKGFQRALPTGCHPQLPKGAMHAIAELTQWVLALGGMDADAGCMFTAADLLLEAWSSLTTDVVAYGRPRCVEEAVCC